MEATTTTTLRFAVLLTTANGFLDAYTYITRGHVFANVQTGNVVLFAVDLTHGHWGTTLAHLGPIFAFLVGVLLSAHIKSGRVEKRVTYPVRWTMGIQAIAFATVGFVPTTVPNNLVTIPISFLAAMQFTLFRSIGDLTYIAVATTGNMMRVMEAGYSVVVDKNDESRLAFRVYGALTTTFAVGAVLGAFASLYWGIRAVWVPAALLAVTLVFFIIDEREGMQP
jgi:uncharacterized membrane protein YoaK (UPF0700 family)